MIEFERLNHEIQFAIHIPLWRDSFFGMSASGAVVGFALRGELRLLSCARSRECRGFGKTLLSIL